MKLYQSILERYNYISASFYDKETRKEGDYLTKGNLEKNEDKIWMFFFRTERKFFKKKHYSFHHMIETDGVSCSLLLLRNDLVGKKLPMMKKVYLMKHILIN